MRLTRETSTRIVNRTNNKDEMRKRVYDLLNLKAGKKSLIIDYFLLVLIVLNCVAIILESVEEYRLDYQRVFDYFEVFTVIIFSIEYLLRVWSIVEEEQYKHPVKGRIRYIFSAGAIIDLLAILPFYLEVFAIDLRAIRIFRLLRLLRLLKVARYLNALDLITIVVRKKKAHLLITVLLLIFMLVVSSVLMYYIENPAQPDKFSSIPETMWWGVATLTTIGYGDMYPITTIGKLLGAIISIIGIGLFALPTSILASGFSEELNSKKEELNKHQNCNNEL